jgi:hypothetical protein
MDSSFLARVEVTWAVQGHADPFNTRAHNSHVNSLVKEKAKQTTTEFTALQSTDKSLFMGSVVEHIILMGDATD